MPPVPRTPKHIRVWCGAEDTLLSYWHHGVLMPDGAVIHLTAVPWTVTSGSSGSHAGGASSHSSARPSSFGSSSGSGGGGAGEGPRGRTGVVERIPLTRFSGRNPVYEAENAPQLCAAEAIRRAESCIGPYDYNLLIDNCETFARWCVSGFGYCDQIVYPLLVAGKYALPWGPDMVCSALLDEVRSTRGTFKPLSRDS